MTITNKGDKTLIKQGRRIVGFVYPQGDNWAYAYGSPSQASWIAFTTDSKQDAVNKVAKYCNLKLA